MKSIVQEIQEDRVPFLEQKMKKEFNMSPAGPEHYEMCFTIVTFLRNLVQSTDYKVLSDVYRYLDEDAINLFGEFKNGIGHNIFVDNLKRFNASDKFIGKKLNEFAGIGVAQGAYAPDVFVLHKDEVYNRFSIPQIVFEILSPNTFENDLHFKPYFYETIGVREYFICQTTRQQGTIIKAYHLVMERYEEIRLESQGYFSEVILNYLPQIWQL